MKALLQERIMSAATLDQYTSVKNNNAALKDNNTVVKSNKTVLAERAEILETVARKAQEKTLTLQETTDLYARFNQTYEAGYQHKIQHQEDESWALKLLEECARESETENALQTRVNGEPQPLPALKLVNASRNKPSATHARSNTKTNRSASLSNAPTLHQTLFSDELAEMETLAEKPKLKLREAFVYDQFNFTEEDTSLAGRKNNQTFWIIFVLSSLFTLAALMTMNSLF
jgi:hypothetical protein